jgi:hypothetical protein
MSFLKSNDLIDVFKSKYEEKGYEWFDKEVPYNLNIFAVRSSDRRINEFDDYIFCVYRDENLNWVINQYPATTDPGLSVLYRPVNAKGTAILVPGQYKGAYRIDTHAGKYEALCQRLGPVKVYRDSNRDDRHDFDPETIDEGYFGINIHKAGRYSRLVDGWSAGCQVFKEENDFKDFMRTLRESTKWFGNVFTFTLFDD